MLDGMQNSTRLTVVLPTQPRFVLETEDVEVNMLVCDRQTLRTWDGVPTAYTQDIHILPLVQPDAVLRCQIWWRRWSTWTFMINARGV